MKEERSGKEGGMYREEYPRLAVHPCGWLYEVIALRGRGSAARQKALLKEEAKSFVGDGEAGDPVAVHGGGDGFAGTALSGDELKEFCVPLDFFRCLLNRHPFMVKDKEEKLFLSLSQLFVCLSHLEVQLFELCLKPAVEPDKLAILADEACELKCMAREAMGWVYVVPGSVDTPFQPAGDDFSAPADEGNATGDTEASDDFFRDGEGV